VSGPPSTRPAARVSLVVAMDRNRVIGSQGRLPWHLPDDLKRFKALTLGHHIVMGRKTYESIGRLLPGRTSVIVTRQKDYCIAGARVARSLSAALAECAGDDEVFVIGGEQIFREALPLADRIHLTEVHADYPGDVHFPALPAGQWREVQREERLPASPGEPAVAYVLLERQQVRA